MFPIRISNWHKRLPALLAALILIPQGTTVMLSWRPNPEPDVMGYRVYMGRAPRSYTRVFDAGKNTRFNVTQFSEEGVYFFAITAYDSSGNESAFSEEVSADIRFAAPAKQDTLATAAYNFPNPFRPENERTQLRYVLPRAGAVSIYIYDVSNTLVRRLVEKQPRLAGEQTLDFWDGRDDRGRWLPNGVYLAVIESEALRRVVKIVIAR